MTMDSEPGLIPVFTMADRLRKARELTNLEQGAFADEAGFSRATVSNAERGVRTPSRLVRRAWALRTGVPIEWLETGIAPTGDGEGDLGAVRHQGLEPRTH